MLDREEMERYRELVKKNDAGTITADEYDEMFRMEQDSIEEDCLRMSQFGY